MTENNLVSIALVCFNQEKYIKEALYSVLTQTYEPLEIIISDDASSDNTWKIIEEQTSIYKGPHKLILNRNTQNLGIGKHLNKVFSLANSELVILAAGDDISFPNRAEKIWDFYQKHPNSLVFSSEIVVIGSNEIIPNRSPKSIEQLISQKKSINGASGAYIKKIFNEFGNLKDSTICEDVTLPLRALLMNRDICDIPIPLVKYRENVGITSRDKAYTLNKFCIPSKKELHFTKSTLSQWRFDLKHANKSELFEFAKPVRSERILLNIISNNKKISLRLGLLLIKSMGLKKFLYYISGYKANWILNFYLSIRYRNKRKLIQK